VSGGFLPDADGDDDLDPTEEAALERLDPDDSFEPLDPTEDPSLDALHQRELDTLEAELRAAVQHRDAEVERMRETQERVEALLRRAQELLKKTTSDSE
jgi:hypothetical protein